MASKVPSQEIDLFAEHSAWLAPRLPDPSRRGLVAWLSAHVGDDARQRLHSMMPILHPLHKEAEKAIIGLLGIDLKRPKRCATRRAYPDRNVDWQATYLDSMGGPPHEFISSRITTGVDSETMSALAGLARGWALALESFDDEQHKGRADRLRCALARHSIFARPVAFGTRHARALARLDRSAEAAVDVILKVLGFWSQMFGVAGDRESVLELGRTLQAGDISNINTLLEITARLSIARVATSVRAGRLGPLWELAPQSWSSGNGIELNAGPWRCHITKGLLFDGRGARIADGLNDSLSAMGLHAVGRQPDIVIKFWHASNPGRTLFVLGDAKRNAAGAGTDYLRESVCVAAAYALAYAQALGLHVQPGSAACSGALNPMVTLFCAQSVPRVAGIAGACTRQADELRRAPKLPAFMAFDLSSHFGATRGEWQAPVLQAWFERISNDACASLAAASRCRQTSSREGAVGLGAPPG
jgi:hypothetical protein